MRLQSCSQLRTCLTTEHAQWPPGRSRGGIPPLRVLPRLRRWALCNRGSRHLRREEGEEGVFRELGRHGWQRGLEGRQNTQEVLGKGVSSVHPARTRAPDTWERFGQWAKCFPLRTLLTACSREFLFQEQNKQSRLQTLNGAPGPTLQNGLGSAPIVRLRLAGLFKKSDPPPPPPPL